MKAHKVSFLYNKTKGILVYEREQLTVLSVCKP